MKNTSFSILGILAALSLASAGQACEDTARVKVKLPGDLGKLSVELTSRATIINGVAYYISSSQDGWCAEVPNQTPNCDLPKVIFVSTAQAKVTASAEGKTTAAAIEFIRLSNGDPVLQLHEVKAPLNAQGFREFKAKGSVKARIYGRTIENADGFETWSMTTDAAKFDSEFGDDGEDISEGIEIRHEHSPLYNRAAMHPSLSKAIELKPSWDKDWNLNCVEGVFSYDDQDDK
jgi:hypothetical protein